MTHTIRHDRFFIDISIVPNTMHTDEVIYRVFDRQHPTRATVEEFNERKGYTYNHARAYADGMNRCVEWLDLS